MLRVFKKKIVSNGPLCYPFQAIDNVIRIVRVAETFPVREICLILIVLKNLVTRTMTRVAVSVLILIRNTNFWTEA